MISSSLARLHSVRMASRIMAVCLLASALSIFGQAAQTVTIAEGNGRAPKVTLAPGDTLEIILRAQAGTGYSWQLAATAARFFTVSSETLATDKQLPGGEVFQLFRIHADSPGRQLLDFQYSRPWEKNTPPARIFRVKLRIR